MEQKIVRPYNKEQTKAFVKAIIIEHYDCDALNIKYAGGGSFGFVYKIELPVSPYKLIVKAFRVDGMHKNEAAALNTFGRNTLMPLPAV